LADSKPVVALESTIIAHGMPYPVNLETALAVEQIVRDHGAIPATLGMLDGEIVAGLSADEIAIMATATGVEKAGERDLPVFAAQRKHAAVTAGASIAIAAAAGIDVFVTGGIGGVGPLASRDFDVSADLPAIAQYTVITVCAGTKAFMDVSGTLEYLETARVPVATYRTGDFPLFYSRSSGVRSPWRVEEASEIAEAFAAQKRLGREGGFLIGVPVPEESALPLEQTRQAIAAAMRQIEEARITGKAVTPFLLRAIKEATGGRSLAANIALIRNNAALGAQIAAALSGLRK
ncbi:MAG: pseudouridine-5'-phosphate glycosidase, partial [Bryobacterales bacterium]|nr:pseudouridine-5'-phosphate glycosidase [Bryobacterales bacterium]